MVEFMKKIDAPALDEPVIAVISLLFSVESVGTVGGSSYGTLLCSSGLPSRSLTFQFLRVGVDGAVVEVFKVSPRDRVLQRCVEQIPLTFRFHVVEVFKVSSQDKVQLLRPLLRTFVRRRGRSRFKLFSHLSPDEKKCGVGSALGVGTECGL